jgi:hypothetical protein
MPSIAYRRLTANLDVLSRDFDRDHVEPIASALTDAWKIVDAAHRMHDLVATLPGLSKRRSRWVQHFIPAVQPACAIRNNVQHLVQEIQSNLADSCTVWGYLRWYSDGQWLAASPGSLRGGETIITKPSLQELEVGFI